MTATSPGDRARATSRCYGRALKAIVSKHQREYDIELLLWKTRGKEALPQGSHFHLEATRAIRTRYRAEFDQLRADLLAIELNIPPEPSEEETEAALASVREAMVELAAQRLGQHAEEEPEQGPAGEEPELQPGHEPEVRRPTTHEALLVYLTEQGLEMPGPEHFPMLEDPDARSYVRDQVMVAAVLAYHLGTSVEECLGIGVAC